MNAKSKYELNYEQLDLFDDPSEAASSQEPEQLWDGSRGRDYIQARNKDGRGVTLVFDHLDQQYHLLDE